ncbi:MAG: GNAT family N-acetyltransferase [Acidobacteriota bacterium]
MPLTIRRATAADVPSAAKICFEAFHAINKDHNFPPDIPSVEAAVGFMGILFAHPGFYCFVAEVDGKVVGSNCLDERSPISGIGPITIDVHSQNQGIGRALMQAVMDRSDQHGFPGIRLIQAAFHNRSLSLYTKLGFEAREPLSAMLGLAILKPVEGCTVRPATVADIDACARVCIQVHGHHRTGELSDAIAQHHAMVVERQGRITGYTTELGFFGHTVAESNLDLQAILAATPEFEEPGFLLPTRNTELLRWCLENGLRIRQPMTLMTKGLYNKPNGSYLPSVTF